ncbi:hypothetical protein [Salinirubrum litoreum]|uniref:Uncharacterized protein n=1 Tax=Salinirubrum litoreum TaxID=1126234 RepID=A0ABD5RB88_9EURY|nr:hypothetical protein [Salinirubrum litoreum]
MSSPALRRTCRRLIAVVLLQLGAISAQLFEATPADGTGSIATFVTIPIFVGAGLYLLGSLGRSLLRFADGGSTAGGR